MPITYDIKKDFLYKKGVQEGEMRGEKRGEIRGEKRGKKLGQEQAKRAQQDLVIIQGTKKGFSSNVLADLTGLAIEEVEARIKELGLA